MARWKGRPVGRWLALGSAGVVAVTLAACSPGGSGGSADASGSTPKTTYVVARTGDIDKLDPQKATAFQTIQTLDLVYGRLVRIDSQGNLVPDLATKWQTSPDGKTVTFTLREGVTWHDGDPFTADDVVASIKRILDQTTGAVARSNLVSIAGVSGSGNQVVLTLSTPNQALLYSLASVNSAILHTKDITAATVDKTPDGTGPFAWQTWNQGQQVVLTGNAKYYNGAPVIKTLEFRVIPAESSIVSGMKAGAFQLGVLSDPSVADQVSGTNVKLLKQPALSYHALMLNGSKGPLADVRVRQAIACAVNRDEVIKTAANGDGKVTGPITSPAFSYSPTDGLPCKPGDTAGAKQLLGQAGFANGFTLNTIVETGEYATAVGEAQNLQSQLSKIGVQLQLQQLTTAPYVQAWLAANYDAAVALNGGSYDPYLMYGRYYTTGGSLAKPAGIVSQPLNDLLVKGNTTSDEGQRKDIYQQLQKELLKESPWVWLFRGDDYYAQSTQAQSFSPRPDELLTSLAASK
ncbi:MAG: transporter substrate-binding protein [Frankiales bacterium]|nr:transporter substrate-binding protein [Frankiales bacterium]